MMNILRQAQDERVNELYTFVVSLRAFVVSLRTRPWWANLWTFVVSLSNRCRSA